MKILVIQNLYPPLGPGGYGLACKTVVNGLSRRGHEVTVLTSRFGLRHPTVEGKILRVLEPVPWCFMHSNKPWLYREWYNNRALRRALVKIDPDLINVWSMSGLPKSMLITAQRTSLPMVYYLHDAWLRDEYEQDEGLTFWQRVPKSRFKRLGKTILKWLGGKSLCARLFPTEHEILDLRFCIFVSESCKQEYLSASYPVGDAPVIYNGIDLGKFHPAAELPEENTRLKLLFAGFVVEGKGVHTIVEALAKLRLKRPHSFVLDVVGPTIDRAYSAELARAVHTHDLADEVHFVGPLFHDEMPDCYRAHDVLIFPSITRERFPVTIPEAMATRLAVISTLNGGQKEILVHGQNCLTYPAGDSAALAQQLELLCDNPALLRRIASNGEKMVRQRFGQDRMLDQVEAYFEGVRRQRQASQ